MNIKVEEFKQDINVYVDDMIVTYIHDIIFKKPIKISRRLLEKEDVELLLEKASLLMLSDKQLVKFNFIFSDTSLEVIRKGLSPEKVKRIELEATWHAFQKGKKIIINKETKKFKLFLEQNNIYDEEDVQHLANATLKDNMIDYFLTYDRLLINLAEKIKNKFGITIKKPSQLLSIYEYIY